MEGPAHDPDESLARVLAANAGFYDAFERRDLDAMSDAWEHSDRVTCVHPGWPALHGWAAVSASWLALFGGPQQLQFIITSEMAHRHDDVAWVTCSENLIDAGNTQAVIATNMFVRVDDSWRILLHHASAVLARPGDDRDS